MADPNLEAHAGSIDVPIQSAVRRVKATVRVRGLRRFKARVWLGTLIIRLAFWVIGMPVEIDTGDGQNP